MGEGVDSALGAASARWRESPRFARACRQSARGDSQGGEAGEEEEDLRTRQEENCVPKEIHQCGGRRTWRPTPAAQLSGGATGSDCRKGREGEGEGRGRSLNATETDRLSE